MKTIGAYLEETESGYCEIILPFNEKILTATWIVHGGILSTMADELNCLLLLFH